MSMALAVDAGLVIVILGLAFWIIAARTAYGAAVGFVAYGLLAALVWVRLAAVDVAMTEAALGSGLTGLLLLGAAARLTRYEPPEVGSRPGPAVRSLVGLLCAAVAIGLAAVVLLLPEPAPSLAPSAVRRMAGADGGSVTEIEGGAP